MTVIKRQLYFWILLLCFMPGLLAAAEPEVTDTRILIDISGSMQKNDPKNLRRSALRLIVGLMPNNNRAGVWTFAQYTNMLVPLGVINESWKNRARAVSEKISSPGQFTNIEDVMRRATADWDEPSNHYRRNLILLTDGMVDISKSDKLNQASRKRILEELGPKIKAMGGKIHTIALSERADHELMNALSDMTGGWNEQVNSADELQRVFLRMFEKVGKPDAVPLQGNKFQLDNSIDEATLLVFSKQGADTTKIMMPDGSVFASAKTPQNVSWHHDDGYDLITIRKPAAGEWTIQADMDPDNRVMVVTNLKMKTTDIPNRLALGESIPVTVHFTDKGRMIAEKQFLDVVNVSAAQFFQGVEGEAKPIRDDGVVPDEQAGDGKFSIRLGEGLDAGKVELVISADGKTFVRERRQATRIVQPAQLEVSDDAQAETAMFSLKLDTEAVTDEGLVTEAWIEDVSGKRTPLEFTVPIDGLMQANVNKSKLFGRHSVLVSVSGKTLSGNDFSYQPEAVAIDGLAEPPPAPVKPVEPAKPEEPVAAVEEAPPAEMKAAPEPEPPAPPEEETDWTMIGLAIGGGNLLLILIGVGVWWFMRRSASAEDMKLFAEEEDQVDAAESVSGPAAEATASEPVLPVDEFDLDADLDSSRIPDEADQTAIDISPEDEK